MQPVNASALRNRNVAVPGDDANRAAVMIRILIADDHAIVRAGLKQFIAGEKDMVVAGESADGMETLAFVRTGECAVVLLDISMPGKNGIDTLRQLKRSRPDLPVLILSGARSPAAGRLWIQRTQGPASALR
jgi:two-component system, NarL family, invasion response regulator UvrY